MQVPLKMKLFIYDALTARTSLVVFTVIFKLRRSSGLIRANRPFAAWMRIHIGVCLSLRTLFCQLDSHRYWLICRTTPMNQYRPLFCCYNYFVCSAFIVARKKRGIRPSKRPAPMHKFACVHCQSCLCLGFDSGWIVVQEGIKTCPNYTSNFADCKAITALTHFFTPFRAVIKMAVHGY